MKIKNKDNPNFTIKVNSHKNRIILTKGFVVINSGSHHGSTRIHPDIFEEKYIIPENVQIG